MKIKNLALVFLSLLLISLGSCKKETIDVTDLLTTVPSSAAGVVVINLENMLEDAGCKIKDHKVTPSPEVTALIEKSSPADREQFLLLLDGEAGVDPKAAVVFYDANRVFLTFALYDVNKFCSFVENNNGNTFSDTPSGVKINGSVAVKGSQAWVNIGSVRAFDADAIAAYAALKPSQSFLVTPNGEKLLTEEDDIRGWAMINTFVNEMLGRGQKSMFTLGLGFLFEDAESVRFKVDFDKGEMESEVLVLNENSKPAKYLLPTDKIDVGTLKDLGTDCDAMMAFTVNPKLIKKFDQLLSAFGGSFFGNLNEMFKNVDGTVGFIAGPANTSNVSGVITTKGDVSKELKDLISDQIAPVSPDGKYLRFSKGDVTGEMSVAECADELKGACLGIVADASGLSSVGYNEYAIPAFKTLVLKFEPESGGLEIHLDIKTSEPKENALLTLIRN